MEISSDWNWEKGRETGCAAARRDEEGFELVAVEWVVVEVWRGIGWIGSREG